MSSTTTGATPAACCSRGLVSIYGRLRTWVPALRHMRPLVAPLVGACLLPAISAAQWAFLLLAMPTACWIVRDLGDSFKRISAKAACMSSTAHSQLLWQPWCSLRLLASCGCFCGPGRQSDPMHGVPIALRLAACLWPLWSHTVQLRWLVGASGRTATRMCSSSQAVTSAVRRQWRETGGRGFADARSVSQQPSGCMLPDRSAADRAMHVQASGWRFVSIPCAQSGC